MNEKPTTLLQIRLLDGEIIKVRLPQDAKLWGIANYIRKKAISMGKDRTRLGKHYLEENGIAFIVPPNTKYDLDDFEKTLQGIGLVPSGTLNVIASEQNKVRRGIGKYSEAYKPETVLIEKQEKLRFEEKLREKEAEEKRKEIERKIQILDSVRKKINEDKEARKKKVWVKM